MGGFIWGVVFPWGAWWGCTGLGSRVRRRTSRHFQAVTCARTSFTVKRKGASSRIAGRSKSAGLSRRTIASRAAYSASARLMTLARVCFTPRFFTAASVIAGTVIRRDLGVALEGASEPPHLEDALDG